MMVQPAFTARNNSHAQASGTAVVCRRLLQPHLTTVYGLGNLVVPVSRFLRPFARQSSLLHSGGMQRADFQRTEVSRWIASNGPEDRNKLKQALVKEGDAPKRGMIGIVIGLLLSVSMLARCHKLPIRNSIYIEQTSSMITKMAPLVAGVCR